ncbi:hypothetical protein [Paenibacillus turpanensis]|uniref:hypothetical protein n=1 Tax=Paenibacillus turpanensis TaxID=2689078 RepID=UPI00140C228A|nr:hypothetical protein [Paenibacillus turpanensis]
MEEILQSILSMTITLANSSEHGFEDYLLLIDLRQEVVNNLEAGYVLSASEKNILSKIKPYEDLVFQRMKLLKDEAEQGLVRIQNSKRQRKGYNQPGLSESIMFDKRE